MLNILFLVTMTTHLHATQISISLEKTLELSMPCPTTVSWDKKETFKRSCQVQKKAQYAQIDIAALSHILPSENLSRLIGPLSLKIYWKPEIKNERSLVEWMKTHKDGPHPRYVQDKLEDKLKKIKKTYNWGALFDLSLDYIDPREPNSPDIILLTSHGTVWIQNAGHVHFDGNFISFKKID